MTVSEIHDQYRDGWLETDAFRAYENQLNSKRLRGPAHESAGPLKHTSSKMLLIYGTPLFEAKAQRWWLQRKLLHMAGCNTARREGIGKDAHWYVGERAPLGMIGCEAVPKGYHIRPIDAARAKDGRRLR